MATRRRSHKDVEFHVESKQRDPEIHKTWKDACEDAVILSASGNSDVVIDVCVWSKAGARWWQGDDGVKAYNEDPEASVHNRFKVKVNNVGRVA